MRSVTVQFLKNPDITHWGFETTYLGEDEFGHWMAVPQGTVRWKGEQSVHPTRRDAVFCAPRDQWWHLHYEGPASHNYSAFIDIATPPRWVSENRYEMIDLDLDVGLTIDGSVVIEDEDEFEIHQIKYGYTKEMIRRALEETSSIVSALESNEEPFYGVAEAWLSRV